MYSRSSLLFPAGISCMFQLLGKEVVSEVSPDKLAQAAILGQVEAVQKILAKFPDKVGV